MLYTILTMPGLRTAIAVRDGFGHLLAGGLATTLGVQVFLVAGGVTNLIPQTGLTTRWTTAAASGPTGTQGRWSSDRRRAGLLR